MVWYSRIHDIRDFFIIRGITLSRFSLSAVLLYPLLDLFSDVDYGEKPWSYTYLFIPDERLRNQFRNDARINKFVAQLPSNVIANT